MAEVVGPTGGELCAGVPYTFVATDVAGCLLVKWVTLSRPSGVSDDDIEYSAIGSLQTEITVPVQGDYTFAVVCCEQA